jgi:formamidopyrimidine-DNA glycosylase
MPELPEVETIRAQLAPRVSGRTITSLEITDALLVAPEDPARVAAAARGRTITAITRRGKYLLMVLDSGDVLAMHLRMTGRLHWRPDAPGAGDERFLRATIALGDGSTVTFGDVRRFGRMWIIPAGTDMDVYWSGRVGVEPLGRSFTAARLSRLLDGRTAPIKGALLNQATVAGLGNMYVDESLFGAGIHPRRVAGSLSAVEVRRLHRAIRDRLKLAIAAGGASIDTYRDGLGQAGRMQTLLRVHLHEGEACPRCGTIIVKDVVAQRGTYWCPHCQPDPSGTVPPVRSRRPRRIRHEVTS